MATSGKRRADDFRLAYYRSEKALGNKLTRIDSDYFLDKSGVKVGITWSKEIEPGKWFLNLMEGKFNEAILLCQTKPDESVVIALPRSFIDRHWHSLSKDAKREVKFSILRERGRFFIRLSEPTGLVDVSEFLRGERVISPEPRLPEYD